MVTIEPSRIIELLGLEPLPGEGGRFRNTLRDGNSTAIYFLLERDRPTMLHRLPGPEVFHFYSGAAATLVTLAEGRYEAAALGPDLEAGERPQLIVPGGVWQAAETTGDWTLLGTTMSPGFRDEDFELAGRADLLAEFPDAAAVIERHTPPGR